MRDKFDIYQFENELFAVRASDIPLMGEGIHLTGSKPRMLFRFFLRRWSGNNDATPWYAKWITEYYYYLHKRYIASYYIASRIILIAKDKEIEYEEG